MISLVWKDLYLGRSMILLVIAMFGGIFVLGVLTGSEEIAMYAMNIANVYSMMMVPFFALNSAANEEKNRTLALLRGMPISPPKRIVASKFVAALLVGVLWSLISVAVMLFGTRLFPGAVGGRALPPTPFLGPYQMALTLPIAAVTLIAFFKWNSSAARTAIMVLWIALYVIPTVFRPAGISMTEFYMKIMSPTPSAISIVLAVSLAIYFLGGMLVAQEIFARRELA